MELVNRKSQIKYNPEIFQCLLVLEKGLGMGSYIQIPDYVQGL